MTNEIFLVLFIRFWDYVFKMSIFKKRSTVLHSVHWCMYNVRIKKVKSPCCSGGKSVNNCINARGVR